MQFKNLLTEKLTGTGDCYEAGADFLMQMKMSGRHEEMDEYRLVHGLVMGQGPLEGVRYTHCWLEKDNMVIDKSNGRNIKMPKRTYYGIGQIQEKDVIRYTPLDAFAMMVDTGIYGPWDKKFEKYP